jgi:hypothetical protein
MCKFRVVKIGVAFLGLSLVFCIIFAPSHPVYGRPPCERDDIPLQMLEGAHLKVIWHRLSLGDDGRGRLGLVNETGKTITSLIVLMSYLDSDGEPIFTIPYFGGLDNSQTEILEIRPYIKTILQRPVKPGERIMLFGTNLETTTQFPARAKVTLVDTEFDDDSNSVSVSNQATNPLLLKLPHFFEMYTDPSKLPDELLLTAALDERGRVGDVAFDQSFHHSDDLEGQVTSQLKLWSFFPATMNGYAVQAHLSLLLRFHDKGIPLPAPTCPLDLPEKYPRTFVMIDLRRVDKQRWNVIYGGHHAHGNFESMVSITLPSETAPDSTNP